MAPSAVLALVLTARMHASPAGAPRRGHQRVPGASEPVVRFKHGQHASPSVRLDGLDGEAAALLEPESRRAAQPVQRASDAEAAGAAQTIASRTNQNSVPHDSHRYSTLITPRMAVTWLTGVILSLAQEGHRRVRVSGSSGSGPPVRAASWHHTAASRSTMCSMQGPGGQRTAALPGSSRADISTTPPPSWPRPQRSNSLPCQRPRCRPTLPRATAARSAMRARSPGRGPQRARPPPARAPFDLHGRPFRSSPSSAPVWVWPRREAIAVPPAAANVLDPLGGR